MREEYAEALIDKLPLRIEIYRRRIAPSLWVLASFIGGANISFAQEASLKVTELRRLRAAEANQGISTQSTNF